MTTVLQNNLRRIMKSGLRLAILLVLPLLFMNLFIPKNWEIPVRVAYIDQDGTDLTALLREQLAAQFQLMELTEEGIVAGLLDETIESALIARQGFTQELLAGGRPQLEAFALDGPNASALVQSSADAVVNAVAPIAAAAGGDDTVFAAGLAAFADSPLGMQTVATEEVNRARTMGVLGFLVQFMLYMSVVTTGLILEERSNRTFYRIFSAPVSPRQYMAGHLLSAVLIALFQITGIFLVMRFVMNVYFGAAFGSILLLFILFGVVCICLGLLITAYCRHPRQAYLAIMLLTTPLVMLGGSYWPRSFMPDVLIRISNLLPTTWVLEGATKLLNGGGLGNIAGEIAILCAFAAIFFVGGVLRKVDIAA